MALDSPRKYLSRDTKFDWNPYSRSRLVPSCHCSVDVHCEHAMSKLHLYSHVYIICSHMLRRLMHVQSPTLKTSMQHFTPMTGAKWQWQCKQQLLGLTLGSWKCISETTLGYFTTSLHHEWTCRLCRRWSDTFSWANKGSKSNWMELTSMWRVPRV